MQHSFIYKKRDYNFICMKKLAKFKLFDNVEMTSGNLFIKILLLSLPAMLTTMMQLLYVTIDLTTVHYGDSPIAMGAIASNNALINLIIVVFSGISIGANVIMSMAKGANDKEKASKVLHTSLVFSLATGILVGIIGFAFSDNLLVMMGTESYYLDLATTYLKIYFLGLPFLMVFNYCAQLLRAQGDSKTPFLALLISGLVNVGFDCLFVFPCHMSVAGVALATIIAEALSALICLVALYKSKKTYVNFRFKLLKIDFHTLAEILRVGLPAGLQSFFFSLPNVFIQSSLYTIDPGNVNLVNGATAANNIEGYYLAGVDAISVSTMSFIAANIGAKKKENLKKIVLYGLLWGAVYCTITALLTLLLHNQLLSLFVDNVESINAGYDRLKMTGYFYFIDFLMLFTAAVLRGFKRSVWPMVTTLLFCTVFRIVMLYTVFPLEMFHTVKWLYALFPITWVLATMSNLVDILIFIPKDIKRIE